MITVATWNVLHRVHAENWGEAVLTRWPDEAERIAAITADLAGRAEQVVALQEVSGDQLASLRFTLTGRTIHTFRYPRVPKPRNDASFPLCDPGEYLVLLVDGPSRRVAAESFADDPGKGALIVEVAGTLIVATHVSGDHRRAGQLTRLAKLAAPATGRTAVLLGDFNADRVRVESGLGPGFAVADLALDALPTRPPTSDAVSEWIDHVVLRGGDAIGAEVVNTCGLSDHNLVRATVTA
ncbi:endonuclease/exonuclease/phosphatase family protein [Streptomyces triculaminicus]|uniref:endonuclease/exonuclease/phosphatase family protein n=1 Tax=Streptomyces triculaminicus TaxID=2816232 RepID=UPI003789D218